MARERTTSGWGNSPEFQLRDRNSHFGTGISTQDRNFQLGTGISEFGLGDALGHHRGGTSGMSGPIVGHVGPDPRACRADRRACRARLRSGRRLSEIALLGFHRITSIPCMTIKFGRCLLCSVNQYVECGCSNKDFIGQSIFDLA